MSEPLSTDRAAPDSAPSTPLHAVTSGITLITGASGGIGFELAKLFAADGARLVLVARDEARLRAAAAMLPAPAVGQHVPIAIDLARPGAARDLVARHGRDGLTVDALINNAGFGSYGALVETDPDETTAMLMTNVLALTELTAGILPGMVARGRGRVLNVASTAAFLPGPRMAAYYASKAYVLSFSEAIAEEVAGSGVTVTALCPGPTRTGFAGRSGAHRSRAFQGGLATPGAVARAGYAGMRRGTRVVVPGVTNRLAVASVRLVPRRLLTRLVSLIQPPA